MVPTARDLSPAQRGHYFPRRSCCVLAEWQARQRVCALSSVHVPPLAIGRMWSTSRDPRSPQRTHAKPSRARARGLTRRSHCRRAVSRSWFLALVLDQGLSAGAWVTHLPFRALRWVQPITRQMEAALGMATPSIRLSVRTASDTLALLMPTRLVVAPEASSLAPGPPAPTGSLPGLTTSRETQQRGKNFTGPEVNGSSQSGESNSVSLLQVIV
jgi:hypothetical protein